MLSAIFLDKPCELVMFFEVIVLQEACYILQTLYRY